MTRTLKLNSLIILSYLATTWLLFAPRMAQDPAYHHFADSRCIFSIPNFWNVFSNMPFLIFGSAGIFICWYARERKNNTDLFIANLFFFGGIFFTGLGSTYYHLHPDTKTLLWDRLPMTISFMAFFTVILSEHILLKNRLSSLHQLLFLGCLSVIYWYQTESEGQGDLRFYVLVQFLPMLLIPLILLLFHSESQFSFYYWCIVVAYGCAKLCECYDQRIFAMTGFISGHSLKHYLASCVPLIYCMKVWNELIFHRV